MVMFCFVQSAPDLHGLVLVGQCQAFDLQQWSIVVDVEHLCIFWICMHCCDSLLSPDHPNTVGLFKEGVGGALVILQLLSAQALEGVAR